MSISTNGSTFGLPALPPEVSCAIVNCGWRRYPHGCPDYPPACPWTARNGCGAADTSYADGVLTIRIDAAPTDCVWLAYFAPYS